jgi:sensor histidine kinase regulating citrate/malate metabolism
LRELALHILDLVENAIRAGATVIAVSVEEEPDKDLLTISVEDNGPGLSVEPEAAADPFFTTKEGKKTGLGISLMKFRAEQAGGCFRMERSPLGGLGVRAEMRMSHVDRSPLGDLAATLASVVCTNPEVELRSRLRVGCKEWAVSSADLARALPAGTRCDIAMARRMRERITEGLSVLRIVD